MVFDFKKIPLKYLRISTTVAVICFLSVGVKYCTSHRIRTSLVKDSIETHSEKLVHFTFAGEVLPFDSPLIMKRYRKAMSQNNRYSKSNLNMIKASKRWFPLMEPILKRYNIPNDFKYIATAESKFTFAFSSKGAGGFWQMMPATARSFGLEVNNEVDERFHPIKSTEVACRLFRETHRIFRDWTSVALAYNMGSTALYKLKNHQKMENVHFIRSNRETERYFFLVMASKDLIENAYDYGYRVRKSGKVSEVKVVNVTESINDLTKFGLKHNISLATLKSFNPWIMGQSLTIKSESKNKKYLLILPIVSSKVIDEIDEDFEEDTIAKKKFSKDTILAP